VKKRMIHTLETDPRRHTLFRPCLHAESGRIDVAKSCIRNYECRHCAFDQWIEMMEEGEKKRGNRDTVLNVLAKAA